MPQVMRFQTRFARAGVVLALAVAAPALLHAQDPTPTDTVLRAGCRRAQAALAQGATGTAYNRAVTNMNGCPAIATEALLAQWERPPRDTTGLRLLGEVTGRVRDRRLSKTAMHVATTPSRPQAERLAAFRALARYADPSLVLWIRNTAQPNLHPWKYVLVSKVDHPTAEEGVEPVGANVRQEVLQTFTRLGQTDADPIVRAIAARIAERVEDWIRLGILGPVQR